MFLDLFREQEGFSDWKYESKFTGDISEGNCCWEKTLLLKPQTFMNLSGESLQKICSFYKLWAEDITVIYDDKDMDFGKVRLRDKGSAGGHNGVKNIIKYFWDNWKRIKVGVWKTPAKYETSDWVLSKFSEEELIDLDNEVFSQVHDVVSWKKITPKAQTPSPTKKKKTKKLYCIGIGGIGVSALARYYLSLWWEVLWSDKSSSHNIENLIAEWCNVIIWEDDTRILEDLDLVIHTEAIPESQSELKQAKNLKLSIQKYNQALASVVNGRKLIAIAWTHGKSTTTSLTSQILQNSDTNFLAIIGTLLKEFDGKNFHTQGDPEYAVIEACEYKEHFLAYRPSVAVITNIEYDHADYFKTQKHYLETFEKFIGNIIPGGFCIMCDDDPNCQKLLWKRTDITYISVSHEGFTIIEPSLNSLPRGETKLQDTLYTFPEIDMKIPGDHVLFDAKLAYIVGHMIWVSDESIIKTLWEYSWVWRRMEIVWMTENGNQLMSDYGHHPTEIEVTLKALKEWYPDKKTFVIFQPHQYSRTLELLDGFKEAFIDADSVIIPNIYESRDSEADKKKIDTSKLVEAINHKQVFDGEWFENTLELIKEYDKSYPASSVILLLWAWDVDNLRDKIKTS